MPTDTRATDLTIEQINQAIADNLVHTMTSVCSLFPAAEMSTVGETAGYFTGVPIPLFNGVVRPRFSEGDVDTGIEAFVARARHRELPMLWQVTPDSSPDNIGDHLEAKGFTALTGSIGMAMTLANLSAEAWTEGPTVERVDDPSEIELYLQTLGAAFGMPFELIEPMQGPLETMASTGLGVHYLARLDGEAVGVATLVPGAGVAGMYNVGTVTSHRGKGIGRALTLRALLDARDDGYQVGVLHSSHMGYSVYRRLGFERYFDIPYFIWSPDAS